MESTGAILAGRRWYDVATARYDGRRGIYGGATAKRAAGDGNLEIFGANVAAQCLDAGLLDELVVHIAPSCSATASASMARPSRAAPRSRSSGRISPIRVG